MLASVAPAVAISKHSKPVHYNINPTSVFAVYFLQQYLEQWNFERSRERLFV